MKTVHFDGETYPALQTNGQASRFAIPFAKEMLSGNGLDIGCNRPEWAFPGSIMIDTEIQDDYDAFNLPEGEFDYIFSSHCLEHIPDWVGALDYWNTRLRVGGTMFLYLPHYSQKYWRPWNNRKHINILQPEYLKEYFQTRGYQDIMVTGHDLYNAFYAVANKT